MPAFAPAERPVEVAVPSVEDDGAFVDDGVSVIVAVKKAVCVEVLMAVGRGAIVRVVAVPVDCAGD